MKKTLWILLLLCSSPVVFGQNYPIPSSQPVICASCPGVNKNLPTYPFSTPIKRHVGRFVDSNLTKDWQGELRTIRGRGFKIAQEHDRIYFMMGSVLASYKLSTFFSAKLGSSMASVTAFRFPPPEQFLPWDLGLYPEAPGSGWFTPVSDGQDRLFDWDWDDRGLVYAAYSAFGWGLVEEGGSAFRLIKQFPYGPASGDVVPTSILAVKSNNRYYALVTGNTNPGRVAIFDTTDATPTGVKYIKVVDIGARSWVRTANGNIAVLSASRQLVVFTIEQFLTGNGGTNYGGPFNGLTTDGASLFVTPAQDPAPMTLVEFRPHPNGPATNYIDHRYNTGIVFSPFGIKHGGSYLTVWGVDQAYKSNVKVFRATPSGLSEINLGQYFQYYYSNPPAGYAKPEGYVTFPQAAAMHSDNGKDYLIFATEGLGDVYELQTRDTVDIDINAVASRGSSNPNSTTNNQGPFYGDLITFKSSTTGGSLKRIRWNFGNPEAGTSNTREENTGTDVSHRYVGLSTNSQIVAQRTVVAEEITDATNSDGVKLNLLAPTARVKVKGTNHLITSSNVASAVPLVVGDKFLDASDGTVEGHYATWILNTSTSSGTPLAEKEVGVCGQNALTFSALYVPYTTGTDGSAIPTIGLPPYVATTGAQTYTVRPFVVRLKMDDAPITATSLVFRSDTRWADLSQFTPAASTLTTVKWEIVNGTLTAPATTTRDSTAGKVETFTVQKSWIQAGTKIVLTISLKNPNDAVITECRTAAMATDTAQITLSTPDPKIIKISGCEIVGGPCTLGAGSDSSANRSGWTYLWKVDGAVSGTNEVVTPNFTTEGAHEVILTASNVIGSTISAPLTLTIIKPACAGVPSNITFSYFGTVSGCSSTAGCPKNELLQFTPTAFGYVLQACDTYTWTFGDNTTSNERNPAHAYAADGIYPVRLVVTNSNGEAQASANVRIGVAPPPVTCVPPPDSIRAVYRGDSASCGLGGQCGVGERVRFTPSVFGYDLGRCPDAILWEFGDSSFSNDREPQHFYAREGDYIVKLTISNNGGRIEKTVPIKVVLSGPPPAQCPLPPANFMSITYVGASSGCPANGKSCNYNEVITFTAASFQPLKGCEVFNWHFGDGTTLTGRIVQKIYSQAGGLPQYSVRLVVSNDVNEQIERTATIFIGNPVKLPDSADFTLDRPTAPVGTDVTFIGSAVSEAPITSWNWTFGDGSSGTGQTVTHKYENPGEFLVSLVARNSGGPAPTFSKMVKIVPKNQFAFLLPVAAHLRGNFESQWRTDLQIFNPDPGFKPNDPLILDLEFKSKTRSVTKQLEIDAATLIIEDLVRLFVSESEGDDSGTVIVRGNSPFIPQMWTRTYNVSASGVGTFGQLIPAISLSNQGGATTATATYVVAGLQNSSRFRTNIGLVNPTTSPITVKVEAYADSVLAPKVGQFEETVQPYDLVQIGNLPDRILALRDGKPYSLRIEPSSPIQLVAYASMIDNLSGDPVFLQAVSEEEQKSDAARHQVLPGVGRISTWRSDVTVLNLDRQVMQFDLTYYDNAGAKKGEAKAISLAPNAFVQISDLLQASSATWPEKLPDSIGTLKIDTITEGVGRYPIVFARTYNDRGDKGTYGQGIPAFAASRANVRPNFPGYLPAIRSDQNYYSNLGLVSMSNEPTVVRAILLDRSSGKAIHSFEYSLSPNQSRIEVDILRWLHQTETRATLKLEIVSGGPVWAFASIIDKSTRDPEYVPAVPTN